MPAKEIKELRQLGKLEEAYAMAKLELDSDPSNVWGKRNMSWVLYSQLDLYSTNLDMFLLKINEVKELGLPATEDMFFDNVSIVISKAARFLTSIQPLDTNKFCLLFDSIRELPIKRKTKWYSVLFAAMQKGMKETSRFIEFAEWWDFDNFEPEDFQKALMPNGKEVMSIVEQGYINYVKHILPKQYSPSHIEFDRGRAETFLPKLSDIIDEYPEFQYPAYFKAKLLLAMGDNDNVLSSLLPFAKKKRNDFWVWEVLADAFISDANKVFACYCKALSCNSPSEMLVGLRRKMARLLIERKYFDEARTEIDLLVQALTKNGYKFPFEVNDWVSKDWYRSAKAGVSNVGLYKKYISEAESLLFSDVPEQLVFVEFVNKDKKILNFLKSENESGFFKYDRFIDVVNIGDVLSVRFQDAGNDGHYKILTASKVENTQFKSKFYREISGKVKIPENKSFGFLDDVFLHPSIIIKHALIDGVDFSGVAIKSYNKEKKQWGWKLI